VRYNQLQGSHQYPPTRVPETSLLDSTVVSFCGDYPDFLAEVNGIQIRVSRRTTVFSLYSQTSALLKLNYEQWRGWGAD
jgi:hypothetical protein